MTTWAQAIGSEQEKPYFRALLEKVQGERDAGKIIYPPSNDVFNALTYTPLERVKVVILGQDPYHGEHQAHGLCFSVLPGVKIPPSLANIYKELANDISDFKIPDHGTLTPWAKQGVLLLNTVLTVEQGKPNSHAKWGWETYTDAIIDAVNRYREHVVFLLWGAHAHKKGSHIDVTKHHVLRTTHPSPLSAHRGFLGCKHFSQTNQYLIENGYTPINWQV